MGNRWRAHSCHSKPSRKTIGITPSPCTVSVAGGPTASLGTLTRSAVAPGSIGWKRTLNWQLPEAGIVWPVQVSGLEREVQAARQRQRAHRQFDRGGVAQRDHTRGAVLADTDRAEVQEPGASLVPTAHLDPAG